MKQNNYLLLSSSSILLEASIITYDLEEVTLVDVLEELDTVSFLTPLKVVIANHANFLTAGASEEEASLNHLLKYLDQNIETTLFFLTVDKMDERKKIGKELKKKMTFLNISPDKEEYLKSLLADYKLEKGVISNILSRVEDDYDKIYQESDKLKLYKVDSKEITNSDVENMLPAPLEKQDQLTFDLIRAIGLKDKREALKLYEKLKKFNIEIFALMGLLESQYRVLYQVKILELGRTTTIKEIKNFLLKLADLDLKLKSGQVDKELAMELLIINSD